MIQRIRMATEEDAEKILNIYCFYIKETAITFECEVPTLEDFKIRIHNILKKYPWIVYEEEGKIIGYAYASTHKAREAYQWNVELSVYLSKEHHGHGVGTALYQTLIKIITYQGYYNAYGCIGLPNKKSIALHKHFGFHEIGILPKTGNKFHAWHDVIWLCKQLTEYTDNPHPPIPANEIDSEILEKLLK